MHNKSDRNYREAAGMRRRDSTVSGWGLKDSKAVIRILNQTSMIHHGLGRQVSEVCGHLLLPRPCLFFCWQSSVLGAMENSVLPKSITLKDLLKGRWGGWGLGFNNSLPTMARGRSLKHSAGLVKPDQRTLDSSSFPFLLFPSSLLSSLHNLSLFLAAFWIILLSLLLHSYPPTYLCPFLPSMSIKHWQRKVTSSRKKTTVYWKGAPPHTHTTPI